MVECPRCGGAVDRLYRPRELLATPGGDDGDWQGVEACRWCIHEVIEG